MSKIVFEIWADALDVETFEDIDAFKAAIDALPNPGDASNNATTTNTPNNNNMAASPEVKEALRGLFTEFSEVKRRLVLTEREVLRLEGEVVDLKRARTASL